MDTSHNPPAERPAMFAQLGERPDKCDSHGAFVSRGVRWPGKNGREVWSVCPACEAERSAAAEAERAAQAAAARAADRERRLGEAGVPARFQSRNLDNFHADTDAKRRALTIARDFAESFAEDKRGSGLILAGLPGTGKTHLAMGVLQALMLKHSVQYLTFLSLIRVVRETWRKDSERTERAVIRLLGEEIDLLVIDEIGATYGTEGEQTILFDVLDRRYAAMRPTILLTNQDKAGFKQFVGDRVFDRLVETSRWVPFDWASYRATARSAA